MATAIGVGAGQRTAVRVSTGPAIDARLSDIGGIDAAALCYQHVIDGPGADIVK